MAPKRAKGPEVGPTLPSNVNDDYLLDFQKALDTIKDHKAFANILNQTPVTTGGGLPEFDEEELKKCLSKAGGGAYSATGNFFWLDLMFSTMRGVPLNRKNIKLMTEHQFATPSVFSGNLEVAVSDVKHVEPQGSWRSVTPEEKLHSFVWAIFRDISDPKVSDKVIKEWVRMSLSVTFSFLVIGTEDWFYAMCASFFIFCLH